MGHARALLSVPNDRQAQVCEDVRRSQLSVRDTETLVKRLTHEPRHQSLDPSRKEPEQVDPNVRAAIDEMSMALGTKVRISPRGPKAGKLEIEYYSQEDLDRIYSVIVK